MAAFCFAVAFRPILGAMVASARPKGGRIQAYADDIGSVSATLRGPAPLYLVYDDARVRPALASIPASQI